MYTGDGCIDVAAFDSAAYEHGTRNMFENGHDDHTWTDTTGSHVELRRVTASRIFETSFRYRGRLGPAARICIALQMIEVGLLVGMDRKR